MKIIRAEMTCEACPTQWERVFDDEGNEYYFRYRFGRVQVWKLTPARNIVGNPMINIQHGDNLDGMITLDEFCRVAGFELASPI